MHALSAGKEIERDENEDTPENYLSSAVQIKLWRERETGEKRSSVMDCVG